MIGACPQNGITASVFTFAAALHLLGFGDGGHGFQRVTSFTISPEWRLSFTTGIDGLSLIMVLLATISRLAAIWFAGTIEKYENAFYAVSCSFPAAQSARLRQSIYFSLCVSRTGAHPTFLGLESGERNRVAAAWKIQSISRSAVSFTAWSDPLYQASR